jgi:D-serine deaminase-like pyridoxal phosphate-dependent protein
MLFHDLSLVHPCDTVGHMRLHELPTPAICVEVHALDRNIDTMAAARPGRQLRPHVKAFKSTELAAHLSERGGHRSFCAATLRELEGLARAAVGDDLLLANETLAADRLGDLVAAASSRITVAVDSPETIEAAATAARRGDLAVLIDVNVGLPRCGCPPERAGELADLARRSGLEVRGVMGYEGHVVGNPDRAARVEMLAGSMERLRQAYDQVGGEVISAGGTGTYDLHDWANEVQAGSYLLMDTHYAQLGLPFELACFVVATVISVSEDRYAVADAGLKAFGMDHGNPTVVGHDVFFCSDEHVTFLWDEHRPKVGDRIRMLPAHIDPTVAYHEQLWLVDGVDADAEVVDSWAVDLRNW